MTKNICNPRDLMDFFEEAYDKNTDLVITYNGKNYRVKHKKENRSRRNTVERLGYKHLQRGAHWL